MTLYTTSIASWVLGRFQRLPFSHTSAETVLCGSEIPEPVHSYGKLNLIFRTDPYHELKGFLFKYSIASQYNFFYSNAKYFSYNVQILDGINLS